MKAQTHYTTRLAATPWMQRGRLALAALLVLLAGRQEQLRQAGPR